MMFTVPLAMFGWPLVALACFCCMPARRAAVVSMIGGWLLLPQAPPYELSGLPDYTRDVAILLGVLVGLVIFDLPRLLRASWGVWDLPMLVWCLCPITSSLSNGLGLYDGLSGVMDHVVVFGTPYLLGRCCFTGAARERELLGLVVVLGLLFVPFVLIELRLGPIFHKMVYGYAHFKWHTIWRLGWYRPPVFLRSGLAVGVWLASCSILAVWGWRTGLLRKSLWMPSGVVAGVLVATLLLMRALNGYGLLIGGLGAMFAGGWTRMRAVMIAFAMVPVLYVGARVVLKWDGSFVVEQARMISEARAESLQSRIAHEVLLVDHALKRPVFGWGTYGRNRPELELGDTPEGLMGDRSITDSLWIIAFGQRGIVGLLGIGGVLVLPALLVGLRVPVSAWRTAEYGALVALAVVATAFAYDGLVNAMYNPVVFTASGAVLGAVKRRPARAGHTGERA